jgi:hypothetical protein
MPEGANHINISLLACFVSCTYGNTFHSLLAMPWHKKFKTFTAEATNQFPNLSMQDL